VLEGCTPWPRELGDHYVRRGYWENRTLANLLEQAAQRDPQRLFLSDRDGDLAYGEADCQAEGIARGLTDLGLRPRDLVLLQLPNVREFVLVFFALQKIGAIPVMCLAAHRRTELAQFAELTGARAHVFVPTYRGFDCVGMARELRAQAPALRHLIATGHGNQPDVRYLGPWLDAARERGCRDHGRIRYCADPFDVAFMLLSGGTTGVPKLIPRTHADYLYNARQCAAVLGWGPETAYVIGLPAAHNFALGAPGMIAAMTVRGRVILCPSTDPDEVLGAIERHRATVMPATPAFLITLLDALQPQRHDLHALRQICVGGQRMLPELCDRLRAAFRGVTPIHAYGMAEGLTNLSRPADPAEVIRLTQGRPVSPADEIRIVNEDDQDVSEGEMGELLTRGPYTVRGYYRAPQHNLAAFTADGYYRTGDLVRMHPSGNLVVEGRRKDVINRGGEKISAEEVENLILAHEKVHMVAVVAIPDPLMGERSCACIVPKVGRSLSLAELNEFLMGRSIAKFKLPERLELLESFPVTAMNKVSKAALREQIAARMRCGTGKG